MEKMKILVIDDDSDWSEIMSEMLSEAGHKVSVASSGSEGLAKIDESFDLIICDIDMGKGMNGFETMRQIKSKIPGARFFLNSGLMDPYRAGEAYLLGAEVACSKTEIMNILRKKEIIPELSEATR